MSGRAMMRKSIEIIEIEPKPLMQMPLTRFTLLLSFYWDTEEYPFSQLPLK